MEQKEFDALQKKVKFLSEKLLEEKSIHESLLGHIFDLKAENERLKRESPTVVSLSDLPDGMPPFEIVCMESLDLKTLAKKKPRHFWGLLLGDNQNNVRIADVNHNRIVRTLTRNFYIMRHRILFKANPYWVVEGAAGIHSTRELRCEYPTPDEMKSILPKEAECGQAPKTKEIDRDGQ